MKYVKYYNLNFENEQHVKKIEKKFTVMAVNGKI